jgi:hypothetical protein
LTYRLTTNMSMSFLPYFSDSLLDEVLAAVAGLCGRIG